MVWKATLFFDKCVSLFVNVFQKRDSASTLRYLLREYKKVCRNFFYSKPILKNYYSVDIGLYTVSQKNDTDVAHYNFDAHQQILVIFGRDVAKRICYQMVIFTAGVFYGDWCVGCYSTFRSATDTLCSTLARSSTTWWAEPTSRATAERSSASVHWWTRLLHSMILSVNI